MMFPVMFPVMAYPRVKLLLPAAVVVTRLNLNNIDLDDFRLSQQVAHLEFMSCTAESCPARFGYRFMKHVQRGNVVR